ncbi:hypothetical protein VTO42DRAFT_2619 [Malbranchea cinnamomea]
MVLDTPNPQRPVVVDPEVRSYVYSLVTALGGSANDEAGRYVLGDDALGCLRDLKKWLRFYDDKLNRMDVARCLGEANLVNGDLIPILALYGDCAETDKHKLRINLACLELLVPLTWPVEPHGQMTINHHKHTPYLQHAQISYKRGLLSHASGPILRYIIRIGLPSMRVPRSERSSRDEGILKLVLYLFRNLTVIDTPPNLAIDGDEDEISRSATINAFHHQDVFALLLTMCSNMGTEFTFQDVIILETLFHLVKGVDVQQLFTDKFERSVKTSEELKDLLQKESKMKCDYAKNAPTRHGHFGTMIWVKRDSTKVSTVSGQDGIMDDQATYLKMDKSKKWNISRRRRVSFDLQSQNVNARVNLTLEATQHLRTFVEEFLDSGFNPLFTHLRKAIEREAERVTATTSRQYFYVVSWFLEAERFRRARQKDARLEGCNSRVPEPDSFGLVASVMNQEIFVTLNRYMQNCLDYKEWPELGTAMRCFTQILLTIREMSESPLDEDREIAENIQNRIFYEETTHDRILTILRTYKDQDFFYLDACTELAHVFLRMLERYSKLNTKMQVRSRKRRRRKPETLDETADPQDAAVQDQGYGSEAEEIEEAHRTAVERSFDFRRFVAKFCNQKSVDTFVALTACYRELDEEQLKRAHRFFYRVAFKQDLSVLLFRVDIVSLFHKMVKGPEGLDTSKPSYKDWEELTRQLIKRLIKKIEQRPVLLAEMLFSKIPATLHYLQFGREKQALTESKPAAEIEVKPTEATTAEEKLRIVVAALVLDNKEDLVRWVIQVLYSGADERKAWELRAEASPAALSDDIPQSATHAPSIAVVPSDETCRVAMYKNGRLRLLMSLSGFELLGDDVLGGSWIIPSSLSSQTLEQTRKIIEQNCDNPASEINGTDPRDLLRRKCVTNSVTTHGPRTDRVDFGSESEEADSPADALFPPNHRYNTANPGTITKRRTQKRDRHGGDGDEELNEEILEARRLARQRNMLARQQKIKSELYVHPSDDETDEEADREFFAQEEVRRKQQANRVQEALSSGIVDVNERKKKKARVVGMSKRKHTDLQNKQRKRHRILDSGDQDEQMTRDAFTT